MAGRPVSDPMVEPSSDLSSYILGPLSRVDSSDNSSDPLEGLLDGLRAHGRRAHPSTRLRGDSGLGAAGSARVQVQVAGGGSAAAAPGAALQNGHPLSRESGAGGHESQDAYGCRSPVVTEGRFPEVGSDAAFSSGSAQHRGQRCYAEQNPGVGAVLDEDMMVMSSVSDPSIMTARSIATAPSSPGRNGLLERSPGLEKAEDRVRLLRALSALHALRPSELTFLLSAWQVDWLLLHDGLCPPAALAAMLRMQAKRRLRRRRGAKRIGQCPSRGPLQSTASADNPIVATDASEGGAELSVAVAATHGHLAEWQRTFCA
mmetsp:Transcript_6706/g.18403  ORF Transcript_6706/g.18403 Transcript_6706/m.18403 type:complete len:317 (-) Transcript_6706:61-1011(-)